MELKDLNIPRCKNFPDTNPATLTRTVLRTDARNDIPENHIGVKILLFRLRRWGLFWIIPQFYLQ